LSDWQITNFEELLAHLDGLLEAAWTSDVEPRLARQLAAVRQRLVRIRGHLDGGSGISAPTPKRKVLRDNQDLLDQFGEIVDAARAGRSLPMTLTHYLHNGRQRLNVFLRSSEHRLASRRVPEVERAAVLRTREQRHQVSVIDQSAFGVAVLTDTPIETDQVVELHCVDRPEGAKVFECLTVYCRRRRDGYHLGLEIFTSRLS
jgi:hypothetical protein